MLCDLARAASDDVLMAFTAALRVVRRTQSVADELLFFENEPVVIERPQDDDVVFVDRVEWRPLYIEAVRHAVEACWRLGDRRGDEPSGRGSFLHGRYADRYESLGTTVAKGTDSQCQCHSRCETG